MLNHRFEWRFPLGHHHHCITFFAPSQIFHGTALAPVRARASNSGGRLFPGGGTTNRDEREQDENALESGLIVRDRTGVRKRILRSQGDTIFWEYADRFSAPDEAQEHSSQFDEFADTHFVVPQPRQSQSTQNEVGEQSQTENNLAGKIHKDTIYVDDEGRRVRVIEAGQKMVQWIEVDNDSGGVTPLTEFLKNYHPEGKAA